MTWLRSSPVAAALAAARDRLPAGALELACHAAVPVAVDAGLLHLLRVNFFLDPPVVLPFEVEAALLLSPLFREVGEDLYEIDPALRDALLAALVARFGPERPGRVAVLLEQYTDQHPQWHAQPELEHAQRLTALNLVDPARAADWLAANRTAAGGPALTRAWFVAMSGRLRPRTSLEQQVRAALDGARATDADTLRRAVTELGDLALLPGADVRGIAFALDHAGRTADPQTRRLAADVLDTVRRLVPPPPRRPVVEETADSFDAVPFPELHGIDPATFDPVARWAAPTLRAPIGSDPDGRPVVLDLNDPSRGGTGPHGLIVGATGSGKSELLRAIILGLAVTHSPSQLNVLPVTYLGRATFDGLELLPHIAGAATELAEDATLPDRLVEVVLGEISHRQEQPTRRHPALLIVVDEFVELLTAQPSVIDLLVTVGRVGRTLGIHLLLAGQRVDEGRLRGLDTYLTYRIALRTASALESRVVLRGPEASQLPAPPGHGYLWATPDDSVHRFRGTPVSVPYPPPPPSWDDVLDPYRDRGQTLLELLVARTAGHGDRARELWLPPLPLRLALGDLPATGVTIGEVDVPRVHQVRTYAVDLSGASGHVAIVGAKGTGKTTALLTVVTSLARMSRPASVYCVGGGLGSLIDLPNVIDVFAADDHDAVAHLLESLLLTAAASDTVLVVDGWSAVLRAHPSLAALLAADRTVIVAADEDWSWFDEGHLTTFGTRVELRLADPATSRISAAVARRLRYHVPGRALVADGLRLQIALPVEHVGGSHDDYLRELSRPDRGSALVRLGTYADGTDFTVDFAEDPHLLVVGGMPEDRAAIQAAISRTVTGSVVGAESADRVADELRRSSGLRTRGADLWVVADGDLDLLTPLVEFLPYARDLRLHVVALTSSRTDYPVVDGLRSSNAPLLLVFREPDENGTGEVTLPGRPPEIVRIDRSSLWADLWADGGDLTVPVGVDPDGSPVRLDLHERQHGIIVGATGSGKSQLLRSLVLGLAVRNSPASLSMLLVDVRGDTFTGLESLPHLAGLATGLGADLALPDRLLDAVAAEVRRRQDEPSLCEQRLLIVIDDVAELLQVTPALVDTLVAASRDLGIHVLVATRYQTTVLLGDFGEHLAYVIDLEAAAPGQGALSVGGGRPHRFQAAHPAPTRLPPLLERLAGHGGPVRQVWLPPLPARIALGSLPAGSPSGGVPLGSVDAPDLPPFFVDVSGASGHTAIVGAPGSGRTTALQTLVTALARGGPPRHVYCVGGGLNTVAALPYVGGVFHRDDTPAVHQLLAFLLRRPRHQQPTALLVVDGWSQVADRHPDLARLLFDGRTVVVAADERWSRFTAEHLTAFGAYVELRLAAPSTSRISVLAARRVAASTPGRGLVAGGLQLQVAAPVRSLSGVSAAPAMAAAHHAYVAGLAASWTGPPAPRVEPDLRLRLGDFTDDDTDFVVDFAHEPHLLLLGAPPHVRGLLTKIATWAEATGVDPAAVEVVVDADGSRAVADRLRSRLPGPDVTLEQRRRRSWWTGPEIWLVMSAEAPDRLDPLAELLPMARDLGFHLVLALPPPAADEPSAVVTVLRDLETPIIAMLPTATGPARTSVILGEQRRPVLLFDA